MSVSVSFYRPLDYFGGAFNKFVSWMTSGEYCHCELVLNTNPVDIMNIVKEIYESAQQEQYSPEDCQRIITQIEMNFFDTAFRKVVQTSDKMVLSFSLLWGHPMSVRVLTKTAHDTWFKIPTEEDVFCSMINGPELTKEQYLDILKFSIEELGKEYDQTGALCSVLPSWNTEQNTRRMEAYFCSEFIVLAYQRVGFMKDLSAKHTTPNSLYQHQIHYINT
jgi:hypothetical protein